MTQVVFVVVFPRLSYHPNSILFKSEYTNRKAFIYQEKEKTIFFYKRVRLIVRFQLLHFKKWIIVYKLCTFLFLFCLVTRLILIDKLIMLCTTPLNMLTLLTVLFLVFVLVLASVLSFFIIFTFVCTHCFYPNWQTLMLSFFLSWNLHNFLILYRIFPYSFLCVFLFISCLCGTLSFFHF